MLILLKSTTAAALQMANSAGKNGRHYAPVCCHYQLPDTCWIIDATLAHIIGIMVGLPEVGLCKHRQSISMIRNVASLNSETVMRI
jgi:hypothetical protein